jgi:hypothetical protein
VLIDECDNGHGGVAHDSSQMSDVVERLLAGCSQDSKAMKTFETGNFVFWLSRPHRCHSQNLNNNLPERSTKSKQRYATESDQTKT